MRSLNKTIQTIAAIKQKRNKYVIAAVVMSLLVVLCVCYSLIVPAISMTDGDSDGVVPRAVKGEDLDVDEGIKQGHPFEPNIVDVNITTGGTSGSGEDQVVKVNFNLSYSLPANAVGFENYQPYIYYKLDDNIKIPENGLPGLNDDGSLRVGDVMDGAVTSGKYYITPEGYIIIRFTDEYLENHDGQDISGTIRFDADVGRGEGENGSDTDIKFNDDITVTIPGFTPEELGISKSGTNNNDGTISWTVTIANPEPIDLNGYYFTDEMLEDVIDGSVEVSPAGVGTVSGNRFTINSSTTETVTVTYKTPVPASTTVQSGNVNNKATLYDNGSEVGSDDADVWFNSSISISKSGTADYENNQATWTITINNPNGLDLGGYTIEDDAFTQDTIISGLDESEYTLDDGKLTFKPGVNDTRINISYPAPLVNDEDYSNTATLKTPDGDGQTSSNTASVQKAYSFDKTVSTDNDSKLLVWTINVKNNLTGDLTGYKITDALFSEAVEGSIQVIAGGQSVGYELDGDTITITSIPDGADKSQITITYKTDPMKDCTSTTEGGDGVTEYITENSAGLIDTGESQVAEDSATGTYKPTNNICKQVVAESEDTENRTYTLTWTVNIEQEKGVFNGKEFTDTVTINNNDASVSANTGITVEYTTAHGNSVAYETLDPENYNLSQSGNQISITFSDNDVVSEIVKVQIVYKTTIDYSECDALETLITNNKASFNNRETSRNHTFTVPDGRAPYVKHDGADIFQGDYSDETSGTTVHKPSELNKVTIGDIEYYLLKYHVVVNQNSVYAYNENIVLKDTLPEGFTLYDDGKINMTNANNVSTQLIEDQGWGNYYTLDSNEDRQVITMYFLNSAYPSHGGQVFYLDYSIKIPVADLEAELEAEGGTVSFVNTIQDNAGNYGAVTQTQTVSEGIIDKTSSQMNNQGSLTPGYITYSVDINPDRLDLSYGDTLTFVDILKTGIVDGVGTTDPAALRVALQSLNVYRVEEDGSETLLDTSQYSYIFDDSRSPITEDINVEGILSGNTFTINDAIPGSKATFTFTGEAYKNLNCTIYYYNDNGRKYLMYIGNPSVPFDSEGKYVLEIDIPEEISSNAIDIEFYTWSGVIIPNSVSANFHKTTYSNCAKLTFNVPDGEHLRIKYTYYGVRADGSVVPFGKDEIGLFNNISVETDLVTDTATNDTMFVISDSSVATSTANEPIELRKVDVGDDLLKLNAAFNLYMYDPETGQWLPAVQIEQVSDYYNVTWGTSSDTACEIKTLSTDVIRLNLLGTDSKDKHLFKLVESESPENYIKLKDPYYFACNSLPAEIPPEITLDDVHLILTSSGQILAIDNVKNISVSAEKTWSDNADHSADSVTLQLYRSTVYVENGFPSDLVEVGEEEQVNLENGKWSHTWSNLPNGDVSTSQPYYYYVKEISYTIGGTVYTIGENGVPYTPSYSGNGINQGGTVSITNNKGLTVEKLWQDADGNPITPSADKEIEFELYRSTQKPTVGVDIPKDAVKIGEYTLNASNNWKMEFDSTLTPSDDGNGNPYYYYVKETSNIEGYTVSYHRNGSTSKATISIVNTGEKADTGVTMPSTGGEGTDIFKTVGTAVIAFAAIGYVLIRRRTKRKV